MKLDMMLMANVAGHTVTRAKYSEAPGFWQLGIDHTRRYVGIVDDGELISTQTQLRLLAFSRLFS
jgi:hypothetical protein